MENQALPISPIARNLEDALRRGVEVVLLVPAEPEAWVRAARRDPSRTALFGCVEALGRYDNFAMVGFTIQEGDRRRPVYVHSKAMLVDDAWATIGSCNLHANSLNGHTEMNASIWDAKVVRTLRCDLLAGHLGRDTSGIDDRDAMQLVRKTAQRNSIASTAWQGSIFALKASEYEG
jgi:phosphatidylserine/phosphatidylglycerophosphate/cardiolipin synthase-like enzyme